eukprot:1380794-Rhodomonas_salina.3
MEEEGVGRQGERTWWWRRRKCSSSRRMMCGRWCLSSVFLGIQSERVELCWNKTAYFAHLQAYLAHF